MSSGLIDPRIMTGFCSLASGGTAWDRKQTDGHFGREVVFFPSHFGETFGCFLANLW